MPPTSRRSGAADERATARRPSATVVRKLARGSLLSRLKAFAPAAQAGRGSARPRSGRPPARRRAARRPLRRRQRERFARRSWISPRVGLRGPLAEQLQGFSWLRDLAAAASREKGARLAEAHGRPLAARPRHQGGRSLGAASVGRAHPLLGRLCALHPVEQPTAAIARRCSTRWRAARATSTPTPTRPPPGLDRVTAWCGVIAAGPARPGRRSARGARRSRACPRACARPSSTTAGWSAARRSSRCCWSTASACCAPAT